MQARDITSINNGGHRRGLHSPSAEQRHLFQAPCRCVCTTSPTSVQVVPDRYLLNHLSFPVSPDRYRHIQTYKAFQDYLFQERERRSNAQIYRGWMPTSFRAQSDMSKTLFADENGLRLPLRRHTVRFTIVNGITYSISIITFPTGRVMRVRASTRKRSADRRSRPRHTSTPDDHHRPKRAHQRTEVARVDVTGFIFTSTPRRYHTHEHEFTSSFFNTS